MIIGTVYGGKAVSGGSDETVGDDWCPISTAPKDGSHILVAFADQHLPATSAHWFGPPDLPSLRSGGWYLSVQQNEGPRIHPTHWKPLPALSQKEQQGGIASSVSATVGMAGSDHYPATLLERIALLHHKTDEALRERDQARRELNDLFQPDRAVRIAPDVRALVIAARLVMDEDASSESLARLDKATEAFSSRVPYEDEPSAPSRLVNP